MGTKIVNISHTFIWRRVHSLLGFWLVIYLFQHLIINSQATLWIGDDGIGFIKLVNVLESLPYLQVVESLLIGIPLLVHGIWGIKRALQAKLNSLPNKTSPSLSYGRNHAFTWQRLSSWILLFGILGHVIQMRFVEEPKKITIENEVRYLNKISFDEGLLTLAPRLHAKIYNKASIDALQNPANESEDPNQVQITEQKKLWNAKLKSFALKPNQVIVESPSPGVGMLLMIRDTFKSPVMACLYTIFVIAAAFHACNGFWTFLITWGVILSYRSQKASIPFSIIGTLFLTLLGLIAIWGSYWINLRH